MARLLDVPLGDVTLVVFTRDRKRFVMRLARAWASSDVRLVIFDNGSTCWSQNEIESLGTNQTYVYTQGGYAAQMKAAPDYVATPYVMRVDDDGMVSPYGLGVALEALQADSSLVGVALQAADFRMNSSTCEFADTFINNLHFCNSPGDPKQRLKRALLPYHVLGWYALQTRYVFAILTRLAADIEANSSCPYASELAEEIGYAWLGPSACVDALGLFRSHENLPINQQGSRRLRFDQWIMSDAYRDEVEYFFWRLGRALQLDEVDRRDVLAVIRDYSEAAASSGAKLERQVHWRRQVARLLRSSLGVTVSPTSPLRTVLDRSSQKRWESPTEFYAHTRDLGPREDFNYLCQAICAVHAGYDSP